MSSAFCQHHQGQAAVGICVPCKKPLCGDCITKIDGINHCRACLEALAPRTSEAQAEPRSSLPARLLFGVGVAALWLLTWLSLSALLPGTP